MSLEFAKAKLETITYFVQEMSRFNFQNGAEGSALRTFIAVADSACPSHFAKTGELRASLSMRSLAKASGMFRGRTSIAAGRLEAFDVLRIESTAKANRKLYEIRPANVWLSWRDVPKNGLADLAIFENQNGPTHEATLDPKTASSARPFPLNKMTDSYSYAFKNEQSDAKAGSVSYAACVSRSHGTASNGGEAPLDGATPAYEPDAIQAAKDAAHKWLSSQYDFDAGHVDDLIDGFGPNACAAARDDAAAALTGALSSLPINIAAQKVEVYSQTALELLRAVHGGPDLRREVYDMGRVVMNNIGMTGERYVG